MFSHLFDEGRLVVWIPMGVYSVGLVYIHNSWKQKNRGVKGYSYGTKKHNKTMYMTL